MEAVWLRQLISTKCVVLDAVPDTRARRAIAVENDIAEFQPPQNPYYQIRRITKAAALVSPRETENVASSEVFFFSLSPILVTLPRIRLDATTKIVHPGSRSAAAINVYDVRGNTAY